MNDPELREATRRNVEEALREAAKYVSLKAVQAAAAAARQQAIEERQQGGYHPFRDMYGAIGPAPRQQPGPDDLITICIQCRHCGKVRYDDGQLWVTEYYCRHGQPPTAKDPVTGRSYVRGLFAHCHNINRGNCPCFEAKEVNGP